MQDVLDILQKRKAGQGVFPHAKGGAIANALAVYSPQVDTAAVSARFTISTPTPDRSEDVVEPSGFQLGNYKANPLVLYDHGFGEITLPIGKSRDPDGKLTVKIKAASVEAECYFAQSNWQGMQVFQLVEEGILNCASVHIDPLEASVRTGADGRRGLHITKCDLLEWSIVGIPCNPEAVRKILDRGKLAERKIAKPIEKMLKQYAAKPKGLVQGMKFTEGEYVLDEGGVAIPYTIGKAFPPKDEEGDEEKQPKPEASDEGEPVATDEGDSEAGEEKFPPSEEGDGESAQPEQLDQQDQVNQQPQDFSQKPGAQLATGIHGAVAGFAQELSSQLARQENDAIQQMANEVVDLLNQIQVRCQEGFKQAYGQDIPAAGGMGQQQPPPQANPQDEQMLKNFVSALKKDAKTDKPRKTEYGMLAIAKGLSDVSMKKQLNPEEIHRLGHWSKRLLEMVDEAKSEVAKSVAPKEPEDSGDAFNKAVAELLQEQKRVSEKLQSLRIA